MNVIAVQLDIVWEDKPANHAKVRALLERANPARDALVLLPEMFATGFSMNVAGITDSRSHETQQFLAETARHLGIYLMGGIVTDGRDGRGRNEAAVFAPDGNEITRYCKMQPFTLGGESDHYAPGSCVAQFRWKDLAVSPFICYDLRFPELFRSAARRGANLFAVIANWPAVRVEHWITLLRARAIENLAYVIGVNRCGADPKLTYPGRSMIIDPKGIILADAGDAERTITAHVDPEIVRDWRRDFPALTDMRDDCFPRDDEDESPR